MKYSNCQNHQFILYGKELVQPGLQYAQKQFIDLDIENTGRRAFTINKGLQATKAFTSATIFNFQVIASMDQQQVNLYLNYCYILIL